MVQIESPRGAAGVASIGRVGLCFAWHQLRVPMQRIAIALMMVAGLCDVAMAGPMTTWSYKVYVDDPTTRYLETGSGFLPGSTVRTAPLLTAPILNDVPLPDPRTYGWDRYRYDDESNLVKLLFQDSVSGFTAYGGARWWVMRIWQRTNGPNGPEWMAPTITSSVGDSSSPFGYGYVGSNRFGSKLNSDGSLALTMETDVVNPYATPEPGTLAVVGIGGLGLLWSRWRKRRVAKA